MLKFLQKNKYMIIVAALVLAGSYGGYKYYQSTQAEAQTVKIGRVTRGDLTETVSATGSLTALDNVDISSKITGRIVEVLVKENQHVNAGDVLVRLDATSLKATLAQMQAKLTNAQLTYKRDRDLLNRGAISQATYDAAYADYLVALSNYEKAASDVNDTVITTPISGYIIGKPTPVGQTISSGISTPQVIMSVATLDNMEIEALVDESDIGQVKEGQKVKFTVDAYPEETFMGTVRLLSKKATTENNVIYYKVYVTVDDAKGKLLPTDIGMVVNDFLMRNFPEIMDYNFTARVEEQFDLIAEGKADVMITETMEARRYTRDDARLAAPLLDDPFTRNQFGILMQKGDQEWLNYVNFFMEEKDMDGTLDKLEDQYIK